MSTGMTMTTQGRLSLFEANRLALLTRGMDQQEAFFRADAGWSDVGANSLTQERDNEKEAALMRRNMQASRIINQNFVDGIIEKINIEIGKIDTRLTVLRDEQTRINERIGELTTEDRRMRDERRVLTDARDARDTVERDRTELTRAQQDMIRADSFETRRAAMERIAEARRRLGISEERLAEIKEQLRAQGVTLESIDERLQRIERGLGNIADEMEELRQRGGDITAEMKRLEERKAFLESRRDRYQDATFRQQVAEGKVTEGQIYDELGEFGERMLEHKAYKTEVSILRTSEDEALRMRAFEYDQNMTDIMGSLGRTYRPEPLNMSRIPDPNAPKMSIRPDLGPQMSPIPPGGISAIQDGLGIKPIDGVTSTFSVSAKGDTVVADAGAGMSTPVAGPFVSNRQSTIGALGLGS